jgi:hypothetical protein
MDELVAIQRKSACEIRHAECLAEKMGQYEQEPWPRNGDESRQEPYTSPYVVQW